ncbi:carbohydrate-binding protein [Erwinia tracheiphila]
MLGNNDGGHSYPQWELGTFYATGAKVSHVGKHWMCLQGHTAWVSDWAPGQSTVLWAEIL